MISQLITEFLTKIDSIIEENPDVEHWCYSVSCGDTRSRRETVHKSTPYNPDDDGYTVDTLCEVLDGLVDEPVRWAWLECRAVGSSRIWCYVAVDVTNPSEQPPILVDAASDASAVMACQLVRVNEQLSNLMQSKDRLVNRLVVQHTETALSLTRLSTEVEVRSQIDSDSSLAEAMQSFAPLAQMALASYLASKQGQTVRPVESEVSDTEPVEPTLSEEEIDEVLTKVEWLCLHSPDSLTPERMSRVMSAFTSSSAAKS